MLRDSVPILRMLAKSPKYPLIRTQANIVVPTNNTANHTSVLSLAGDSASSSVTGDSAGYFCLTNGDFWLHAISLTSKKCYKKSTVIVGQVIKRYNANILIDKFTYVTCVTN